MSEALRVLVVHNHYRSEVPSGENGIVREEANLLRAAGVDVEELYAYSDEITSRKPLTVASAAIGPVFSPSGRRAFSNRAASFRPHVVHLHNVFPLISPDVVRWASNFGAGTVQTVHNYRHTCVNGMHFRGGAPCDDCVGRVFPTPAVQHSCYRGSRLQSLAMGVGQMVHRSTWLNVAEFLVMSRFMAGRLTTVGVPRERITVRRTSTEGPDSVVRPNPGVVLYVGRLEESKGIELLLNAWRQGDLSDRGWRLRVAGSGPALVTAREYALADGSVDILGRLSPSELEREYRMCAVVAVPSLWYEGFPRVVAEAFAHGRPVLASNLGSLASEIDSSVGWIVDPTQASWSAALRRLPSEDMNSRSDAALSYWQEFLSPSAAIETLRRSYTRAARAGQSSNVRSRGEGTC